MPSYQSALARKTCHGADTSATQLCSLVILLYIRLTSVRHPSKTLREGADYSKFRWMSRFFLAGLVHVVAGAPMMPGVRRQMVAKLSWLGSVKVIEITLMRKTIIRIVADSGILMLLFATVFYHSVNAGPEPIAQARTPSDLSLCELNNSIKLYQNKVVRVRATIVGKGGHYPFFVTAKGCQPDVLIVLWVGFHNRSRTEAKLQKHIDNVLRFNLENDSQKAEAIIVGRIRKEECDKCVERRLGVTLMDVESIIPESNGRE